MAPLLLCPVGRVSPRWRPRKRVEGARGGEVGALPNHLGTVTIYRVKDIYLKDATQRLHFTLKAYAVLY